MCNAGRFLKGALGGLQLFLATALLLLPESFSNIQAQQREKQARVSSATVAQQVLSTVPSGRGICAFVGLDADTSQELIKELLQNSELIVFVQARPEDLSLERLVSWAQMQGCLGSRLFAYTGSLERIALADDVADVLIVAGQYASADLEELLRAVRPKGKVILPGTVVTKPIPEGVDYWSHPYHGPDNNPLSSDRVARWPYATQFLAEPKFCPMPEVTVAAGGKVYRAFGHIAHKANQNPMLNTLICVNAYNGAIIWRRALREGFMIHRNTMIATPDVFYLADDQSCKLIDPDTGKVLDEIVVPDDVCEGKVWKWMALVDGILYAMVGGKEVPIHTQRSDVLGLGHWPWGMWEGHDYADPRTNFAFGKTFFAIEPKSKKILWVHRTPDYVDGRGVCLGGGRIYYYCPGKLLAAIDCKTGQTAWATDDRDLLEAIGPNERAQLYLTGYATTCYLKYAKEMLFFAGPQRRRLVVVSAKDGSLLWQKEYGNFNIVLRPDGIYAAGPQNADLGGVFSYDDGHLIAPLPRRRACTRATGSIDSVFYRAAGGTVRIDVEKLTAQHIAPMRPPCQDGVVISDGHLYWGPWMCGCQLSLYGHIGLSSAAGSKQPTVDPDRHVLVSSDVPATVRARNGDWPTYCGDNARSMQTSVAVPHRVKKQWQFQIPYPALPTAPIAVDGMVFFGDRAGIVRAVDAESGTLHWQFRTAGPIFFPPAFENGRLFVGSADGYVYALSASDGKMLWKYRISPRQRLIPVYGQLISTWPVAGGVVVSNGVVYAAAGITHYDGTYVAALDAATGKPIWINDSSGTLSEKAQHGVSLQGELQIRNGRLQFLGGGVVEVAQYDLKTGKCLNTVSDDCVSRFHTAFWAYYPEYGKYVCLDYTLPDGRTLRYDVTYEGSRQTPLMLLEPLPKGAREAPVPVSRWPFRPRRSPRKPIWIDTSQSRYHGFVIGKELLVVAAQRGPVSAPDSFVAAIRIDTGEPVWKEPLPAEPVRAGICIDAAGRITVSAVDGTITCFAPTD